jgi:hypothetical protein
MNDVGKRLAKTLDQGTRELDQATLAKLAAIRHTALSCHHPAPHPAGHGPLAWTLHHPWRTGLFAACLLSAVWLGVAWQLPADSRDIDILLLTDELPPQAYAEKEFISWLKSPAR